MNRREGFRFFRRKKREEDFAAEVEAYLEEETARNLELGMDPAEASAAAVRKFGNVTRIREIDRDMNSIGFVETIWQDLRYAVRQLRANPGFFFIAVSSLALGIGANTAIFHLLDAVRLRTLPVKEPQQLAMVRIAENDHCCNGNFSNRHPDLTYPMWEQISQRQQAFTSMLAFGDRRFNIGTSSDVRYAEGLWVSGQYFSTLGINPVLGRFFNADDDRPGCPNPGAVLSYALWMRNYDSNPAALGATILIEGHPFPIMGIAPASFYGVEVGKRFDIAVPLCAEPLIEGEDSRLAGRHNFWLAAIGRLKPGWSIGQATAQLQTISPAVFGETIPPDYTPDYKKYYAAYKLESKRAGSGVSGLRKTYSDPLWILLSIAGLVLLIACANLSNLLLARAGARTGDGGSAVDWRIARSPYPATVGGEPAAGIGWYSCRSGAGTGTEPLYVNPVNHQPKSSVCGLGHRLAVVWIRRVTVRGYLPTVRTGSGFASHPNGDKRRLEELVAICDSRA